MTTTTTAPKTLTITRRSRNLGVGWSNTPSGRGTAITPPTGPSVVGTLRDVQAEYERAVALHSGGTHWCVCFYVGETRVTRESFLNAMSALLAPGEKDWAGHTPRYMSDAERVEVVA